MDIKKELFNLTHILHSSVFNILSTSFLILLYTYFLFNHILALRSHTVSSVIIVVIILESIAILLLVMRKRPSMRAVSFPAWFFTITGTYAPLLLVPTGTTATLMEGNILVSLGGALAIGAYLSLNNSFGLAPALREVKTRGLYGIVRHPMYTSYFVMYTGYLLLATTPFNIILILTFFVCLLVRIHYEELLLTQSPEYQSYMHRVRYRCIPGVY